MIILKCLLQRTEFMFKRNETNNKKLIYLYQNMMNKTSLAMKLFVELS